MIMPTLTDFNRNEQVINVFGGYNHNQKIGDNEFYEMKNMSSDMYPLLAPRRRRGTVPNNGYANVNDCRGIIRFNDILLAVVENAQSRRDILYYYDEQSHRWDFAVWLTDVGIHLGQRQLVPMGNKLIIFPDRKYIEPQYQDIPTTWGNRIFDIDRIISSYGDEVPTTMKPCTASGAEINVTYRQSTVPRNPSDGAYWVDTSSEPRQMKQYSENTDSWTTILQNYIKLSIPVGVYSDDTVNSPSFENGDVITLYYHDRPSSMDQLLGSYYIEDQSTSIVDTDTERVYVRHFIFSGYADTTHTFSRRMFIRRTMPDFDYVCESGNRLWACRFGKQMMGTDRVDGASDLDLETNYVNEIYASKLGDPTNWQSFQNISTDSYTASVGSAEKFTGAVTFNNSPIFFKENSIYKVFGMYPAQYQIQETKLEGIEDGSSESIGIYNNTMFYNGVTGIMAYDGSIPVRVSDHFGTVHYKNAVGNVYHGKYYVSLEKDDGSHDLMVYDITKKTWHREDDIAFASRPYVSKDIMYFIKSGDGVIRTVVANEDGANTDEVIEWSVESGILGEQMYTRKYISRMIVRMALGIGSQIRFYIQYDSSGEWEPVWSMNGTTLKSFSIPIKTKRCDHFRMRIEGKGDAKIFSITKVFEEGSEI